MYRLGFDIGGTHIACGIINDETFEIVGKDACAFFRGQSAEKTAQCMAELAKNTAFEKIRNSDELQGIKVYESDS